jgi:hypothetical protein
MTDTTKPLLAHAAIAAVLLACGGGGGDDIDAAPSVDARVAELAGACPLADKVGTFDIAHREIYSAVTGDVANAVVPLTVLQPAESEGGCTLYRKVNPFCDPPCTAGDVCNHDELCVPFPTKLSAGTVTITGLTAELVMEPNVVNSYQATEIDHPPFTAATPILLSAAGSEVESFMLDGIGVEPLVVTDDSWTMVDGDPLAITWTAASGDGAIKATFNVDQHGNSPVTMFCDFPDTGTATVPATLVEKLIEYGMSGAASGHLFRHTVDSVTISEGCVELNVFSHHQAQLAVQ